MKDPLLLGKSPPNKTVSLRLRKELWNLVKKYILEVNCIRFRRKEKEIFYYTYIQDLIVKDLREKRSKGKLNKIDNELLDVLDKIKPEEY